MAKKKFTRKNDEQIVEWKFPFEKQNWILFGIGFGVVILGFLLMATGITEEPAVADGKWNNPLAVVVAPILLIIGYCIIIPYAIIKYNRPKPEVNDNAELSSEN